MENCKNMISDKNCEYSSKSSDSGIVVSDETIEFDSGSFRRKQISNDNIKFNDINNFTKYNTESQPNNNSQINVDETVVHNNENSSINNYEKVILEDSHSIISNISSSIKSNGSQDVYINSINSNDNESYRLNSDSDEEFDNNNCIVRKLGEHHNVSINPIDNVQIVKQEINGLIPENNFSNTDTKLNINHLSIGGNTSNVTVGNKYIFDGNVVIKQFVIEKQTPNGGKATVDENGTDNFAYESDKNEKSRNSATNSTNENIEKSFIGILKYKLVSQRNILILSLTIIILLCIVLSIIGWKLEKKLTKNNNTNYVYQIGDGDDSRKNIPIDSSIGSDILAPGQILRIITRSEWVAQPPNVELTNLTLPAHRVIIAHTATEPCDTQAQCTFHVRYIQTFHIESRNFDDIAYNFLVGGEGSVYEGRGWDKMGAHTKGYNTDSICIAFIGTFNKIIPPEGQLNAARLIIQEGVRLGKLTSDFKLYAHRQLIPSESPGVALFKILQKWPNFATEVPSIKPIIETPSNSTEPTNESEQVQS